ncbi:MAG: hypothetical protein LBP88_07940 [Treponema sp.]|jgi:glycerol kinase|nr:hypothetical protein [Treponema sp.]
MGAYIAALDQGTASSRALLFDREQQVIGITQKEVSVLYPREGWVEQDPREIYSSQYAVMLELLIKHGIRAAGKWDRTFSPLMDETPR